LKRQKVQMIVEKTESSNEDLLEDRYLKERLIWNADRLVGNAYI